MHMFIHKNILILIDNELITHHSFMPLLYITIYNNNQSTRDVVKW